jgi:Domain of unknown function (DUF5667)
MKPADRRPNESIADVLDECRLRLARGESIERCLAAYPAHAAELAALLPVVARAQRLARDPDPAYAAAARRRFGAAVDAARAARGTSARRGVWGWLRVVVVTCAVVLVLAVSGVGLDQAAADSLPDSPLYPVKQAQETVAQFVTRSPDGQTALEIRLARQRLRELELAEQYRKPSGQLGLIVMRMVALTNQATNQAAHTSGPAHDALVGQLRQLLPEEQRALERLAGSAPSRAEPTLRQLLQELQADERQLGS